MKGLDLDPKWGKFQDPVGSTTRAAGASAVPRMRVLLTCGVAVTCCPCIPAHLCLYLFFVRKQFRLIVKRYVTIQICKS